MQAGSAARRTEYREVCRPALLRGGQSAERYADRYADRMCERRIVLNYTYILRCSDGTFYTGWTNHLEERVHAHNEGRGAKYTRSRSPVELVYYEEFGTKREAMSREAVIKRMTRVQKLALVEAGKNKKIDCNLKRKYNKI